MQNSIHIEQITPQLTWKLRKEVLYPHKPIEEMGIDEDIEGTHFGAFLDNKLIGIVSLFKQGHSFQFRKFAIDPAYQKKGYGSIMLAYLIQIAQNDSGKKLWCNARLNAIDFYLRRGFAHTGKTFSKNGFDYEILEKDL